MPQLPFFGPFPKPPPEPRPEAVLLRACIPHDNAPAPQRLLCMMMNHIQLDLQPLTRNIFNYELDPDFRDWQNNTLIYRQYISVEDRPYLDMSFPFFLPRIASVGVDIWAAKMGARPNRGPKYLVQMKVMVFDKRGHPMMLASGDLQYGAGNNLSLVWDFANSDSDTVLDWMSFEEIVAEIRIHMVRYYDRQGIKNRTDSLRS